MSRTNLFGWSCAELEKFGSDLGLPTFRGRQIYRWLYSGGATDFRDMTDLPVPLRDRLTSDFSVWRPIVVGRARSRDGTVKFIFELEDERRVESVCIPDEPPSRAESRYTICLSTQVGCPLKCTFCYSGTVPFVRNLTPGEILGQYDAVRRELLPPSSRVNLVFMGMGEPLLNRRSVLDAIQVFTDSQGYAISPRRITVSTAGLADELERFVASAPGIGIAISLHATTNTTRGRMMPINGKHPLEALIEAARRLPLPRRRRITFEYVLLGGENDTEEDAFRLAGLLRGIKAKVNLIEYNPWPGSRHRPSSARDVDRFVRILTGAGYTVSLRRSRGDDILAACGQLT